MRIIETISGVLLALRTKRARNAVHLPFTHMDVLKPDHHRCVASIAHAVFHVDEVVAEGVLSECVHCLRCELDIEKRRRW